MVGISPQSMLICICITDLLPGSLRLSARANPQTGHFVWTPDRLITVAHRHVHLRDKPRIMVKSSSGHGREGESTIACNFIVTTQQPHSLGYSDNSDVGRGWCVR